jgi:hypothetical protein
VRPGTVTAFANGTVDPQRFLLGDTVVTITGNTAVNEKNEQHQAPQVKQWIASRSARPIARNHFQTPRRQASASLSAAPIISDGPVFSCRQMNAQVINSAAAGMSARNETEAPMVSAAWDSIAERCVTS